MSDEAYKAFQARTPATAPEEDLTARYADVGVACLCGQRMGLKALPAHVAGLLDYELVESEKFFRMLLAIHEDERRRRGGLKGWT